MRKAKGRWAGICLGCLFVGYGYYFSGSSGTGNGQQEANLAPVYVVQTAAWSGQVEKHFAPQIHSAKTADSAAGNDGNQRLNLEPEVIGSGLSSWKEEATGLNLFQEVKGTAAVKAAVDKQQQQQQLLTTLLEERLKKFHSADPCR